MNRSGAATFVHGIVLSLRWPVAYENFRTEMQRSVAMLDSGRAGDMNESTGQSLTSDNECREDTEIPEAMSLSRVSNVREILTPAKIRWR